MRAGLWREAVADAGIALSALALYLATLAPGLYTLDSAELAAGAYVLGIVHATGYPVYLLLAKGFTLAVPSATSRIASTSSPRSARPRASCRCGG